MPEILIPTNKDPKQRGFILLLHTLMVGVTIAMVGLAVDAGTMYVIKGRLSSAVDAAALAAGRSVNLANTVTAASAAATTTATQFFNANFPSGYLGTGTMNLTTPTFVQQTDTNGNPTGILNITVTASVPAPTYFMRIFGITSVTVSGTGTATRRGTVMMLVLDISISMITPLDSNGLTACEEMAAATQQFITNFSPYDTVGVVTFNATATLMYPPDSNFGSGTLGTELGNLGSQCGSSTNTTAGLYLAYEKIKSVGLPLAYNSIVLFTDGSPNGADANFPVRLKSDARYGQDSTQTICSSYSNTCVMPVLCTSGSTVTGTITQGNAQQVTGSTSGIDQSISTDANPVYPPGCSSTQLNGAVRQLVAYIPDTDMYGNSTHGVAATATGGTAANITIPSTNTTALMVSRDNWIFQENNLCASGGAAACSFSTTPSPQNGGALWSAYSGVGTGSNFFTAGQYKNFFRPDQPNTIVAVSMNTAMAEAYNIRADQSGCGGLGSNGTACTTKYHPVINTIYLTGNATDSVDREFLPIMANVQTIPALPYDPASFVPYANPAFEKHQEQGLYQVTADKTQLGVLFSALASEVLRLSN